ncbi:MAG: lytic murein transglycosylase [Pseudolabrys sp.]|nr:lytic murein transglycosylase [Pseudolabrys sp.]MBV9955577.1 lytic murein transglycosylase [Pseudolabrys sp.]
MKNVNIFAIVLAGALAAGSSAFAAQCNPPGGFDAFIKDMRKDAAKGGVSPRGLAALDGITLDEKVLAADKRQGVFKQTFEQFSGRMISKDRLTKGGNHMLRHASMLSRIEQQFGVPGSVIVAIWGLETDFGVNQGKMSVVRSTATLAFDCRRSEKFQGELIDALRIIDKGDMTAEMMKGDWAGEIGQTQFLPSSYNKYAVDFDGDRRRDLVNSVPDVLASTANYLKGHGWQRGKGWGPDEPNFEVIKQWNKADVYARTIALFAQKLDGGGPKAADVPSERSSSTSSAPQPRRILR